MTDQQLDRAVQFANPVTGEVLTLAAETGDLGRYLADLREFESVLREHKRIVSRELLARMDRAASWTFHAGALKLTGQSPAPVREWDGAELRDALLGLVDEGLITVEAVDAAVETVVSFRPRAAGISALRKLGGRVVEVVDSLCRESERERRISVSRSRT